MVTFLCFAIFLFPSADTLGYSLATLQTLMCLGDCNVLFSLAY